MVQSPISKTQETLAQLKIAAPLMLAYVVDIMGMIITKAVVGRLGHTELAAVGVAADISFQLAIVSMGFFSVVGVLVAGALGAKRREDVLAALFQGLWLAVAVGITLGVAVWNMPHILRLLGQEETLIRISTPYAHCFAFAMVPFLMFAVLRNFAAAMMRSSAVLVVAVASVAVQYLLNLGLVLGLFGLPRLEVFGSGLALLLTNLLRCALLGLAVIWIIRREKLPLPHGAVAAGVWKPGAFVLLGLPVAGIVALESGLFASASIMSGWLGSIPLASYQMVMGWISLPFVISLGFSEATMVRVSYWMGARQPALARSAGHLGMVIGVGLPLILVLIPLLAPQIIIRVYLDPADSAYAELSAMVGGLLVIGAIFQVFDGLQVIASHALRGLKDAFMPLVIAGTGYWVIGLVASYLLAFPLGWGVQGLWWGIAAGLAFTAILLAVRFELLSRRHG